MKRLSIFSKVISFFFLLSYQLNGQVLEMDWERTYQLGKGEVIHAFRQSINGWLVAVGEVEVPGQGKNGFFLVLDQKNGRILFNQAYGGEKDDALFDVRQNGDGTFYLVGYTTSKNKKESDGWLLHVDEEGKLLAEATFGGGDEERFTHAMILPDGALLVAGRRGKRVSGDIWINRIEQMDQVNNQMIGDGKYQDVVGIFNSSRGTVWLSGNVTKRASNENGAGWAVELDEKGNIIAGSEQFIDAYEIGELNSMEGTIFGNMLLAGTSLNARQRDAWIVELDENGNELLNFTYNDRQEEFGIAAFKTIQDHYLVARQIFPSLSQIVLIDRNNSEFIYEVPQKKGFLIRKILYTYNRKFLLAGEYWEGRERHLRLICLQSDQLLALAKSETQITCSQPVMHDENNDGYLTPGERGYLEVEVTNIGKKEILDGQISVVGLPASSNFSTIYFSFLPAGGRKKVNIPINGNDLIGGVLKLTIQVRESNRLLDSFPFEVRSQGAGGTFKIYTSWETPYSNSVYHNNRPARVVDGSTFVKYKASTNQALKSTDFKVKKNGTWLEDNKQGNRSFEAYKSKNNLDYSFDHIFSFEAILDTGYNEFIIEVISEGKVVKRDTLAFLFSPQQPNLHVMSIGPNGVGLNFNAKDALDFAGLMEAQRDRDYFNEVFIDTLVTREQTTAKNLGIAFANLQKRFRSSTVKDQIAPNDVLVIFISSHGLMVGEDGINRFKIMASDYDPEFSKFTTVDYEDIILRPLRTINCKKIIFIDACHSAAGAKNEKVGINKVLLELNATLPGLLSITSSGKEENSYENELWKNGAFTKAIKEAFYGNGSAGKSGGVILPKVTEVNKLSLISLADLFNYISVRVPDLVNSLNERLEQTPYKQTDNPELENIKFLITKPDARAN